LHFGNYASQIRLTINKLQRKLRFGNASLRGVAMWSSRNIRKGFRLRQGCAVYTGQLITCFTGCTPDFE
jgi:hypothetical protein